MESNPLYNLPRIRVLLVDDHQLVREGLRACLELYNQIDIIGEASSGKQALELARELNPEIVLMDINMPDLNGLDAAGMFTEQFPEIKLLIVSMHDNREYIASALQFGARGYILKDVPSEEVVTAIEAVHKGGTYFSSGVSEILLAHSKNKNTGPLTAREQSILLMLAEGCSNKHVARELDISVRTAETHRRNIKRKLNINSTAGLTRYAIEQGLTRD